MYVFDSSLSFEENAAEMTAAMQAVCTLSMTQAVRDADIDGMHIEEGQVLGMVNGKVRHVANTPEDCMQSMVQYLSACSCVTVFYGSEAQESSVECIEAMLHTALGSDVDIAVMDGGQPIYSFIISGE
jgi:dihydroxyacetone kinase-like predicted kinase